MADESRIPIKEEHDVITARGAGRTMAVELGFGSADQTRLATAISELARNVLSYAQEGACVIRDESDDRLAKIVVQVVDEGPGIANVEEALADGRSTGGGLGAGLSGAKRLMHEFDIESNPGSTTVTIALTRRKR